MIRRLHRGLRNHPGVFPATALTAFGAVAGAMGNAGLVGGAALMAAFVWTPVLLTAWQRGGP